MFMKVIILLLNIITFIQWRNSNILKFKYINLYAFEQGTY